ncbi:MAG: hypothetical protein WC670_12720 [Pseudolabrys sp.]|jgi:hypothetical protein
MPTKIIPPVEPAPEPAAATPRLSLAQRLEEAVGEQIDAITRVARLVGDKDQADLGARATAALSRSLRETHELIQPPAEKNSNDADRDFALRDIEDFRRELAQTLRGIIAARRAGVSERTDGDADGAAPDAAEVGATED